MRLREYTENVPMPMVPIGYGPVVWQVITFAETGMHSNIGQRLKAVEKYLKGTEVFLANYADGLTDMDLPRLMSSPSNMGKSSRSFRRNRI